MAEKIHWKTDVVSSSRDEEDTNLDDLPASSFHQDGGCNSASDSRPIPYAKEEEFRQAGSTGARVGPTSGSRIDGRFPIKLMSAGARAPRSHTISPGRPFWVMNGQQLFSIVSRRYTKGGSQ